MTATGSILHPDYSVNEVDLHITTACTGKCLYCYVGKKSKIAMNPVFKDLPPYGDTEVIKEIILNIKNAARAKVLVLVGGDPCEHPNSASILRYAFELGGMDIAVLSNTHIYDNGKVIPIEEIVPFVAELDFTLHGKNRAKHQAINRCKGSYDLAMAQLKKYVAARNSDQSLAIVLNFVPDTLRDIEEIMLSAIENLHLDPERDYFMVQRIAPEGAACEDYRRWMIPKDLLVHALEVARRIKQDYGFEMKLDTVDVFPWCAIPEEYHDMLHKGGCQWGRPGGVLSLIQTGGIQRCALSERLIGNMLDLKRPDDFARFMQNPVLEAFRNRRHLDAKCLNCKDIEKCGGGCVIAAAMCDPYATDEIKVGHDYLAD